jgi:fumarate hydratase class II
MTEFCKEYDSLGEVDVPADKLWGAHPALARTFQHQQGSDPARDGRAALSHWQSKAMQGHAASMTGAGT